MLAVRKHLLQAGGGVAHQMRHAFFGRSVAIHDERQRNWISRHGLPERRKIVEGSVVEDDKPRVVNFLEQAEWQI